MANILAIGAHPDDIELGIGGSIAELINQGNNVVICDLTNGEPTPHGSPEKRAKETEKANSVLKVKNRINLGFSNRWLEESREAKIAVAEVYRQIRPDITFIPWHEDAHPDHVAASKIAKEARFIAKYTKTDMKGEPFYPPKLYYYICSHLKKIVAPTLIFDISKTMEVKIEAIKAYQSQFFDASPEREKEAIEKRLAHAAYFGSFIGVKFGEPFIPLEEIGISSFDGLLT